jgi:hypothetical protein
MPHPVLKKKLEDRGITILSDNFDNSKYPDFVNLKCPNEHILKYTIRAIENKLKSKNFCDQCGKREFDEKEIDEKTLEELKNLCESKDHTFLEYMGSKGGHYFFKYECGGCGEISQSNNSNMKKNNPGVCKHCNQYNKKNDSKEIEEEERSMGIKVLRYINNKTVVFLCSCGNPEPATERWDNLRAGRRCWKCAPQRRENTCMEKYGVKNAGGAPEILDKIQDTNIRKYGVPWVQMNSEINSKTRNTMMARYGFEFAYQFPESIRKNFEVMMEKYGVLYNLQRQDVRDKCIQRSREMYGTDYPLQNPIYFQRVVRHMFRKKPTLVNGIIRNLLGYEPQSITYITSHENPILHRRLLESELLLEDEVKTFNYVSEDRKYRFYFPDIEVRDMKQIIEVKSVFTFNSNPERNILKFLEVARQGYYMQVLIYSSPNNICDLWVFTPKGNLKTRTKKTIGEIRLGYQFDGEIDEDAEMKDLELIEDMFCDEIKVSLNVLDDGEIVLDIE